MIEEIEDRLKNFKQYVQKNMEGYEKGEAQLFLERLFQSFGHEGLLEAGAGLEARIKINKTTKFCDLLWSKKVLIEMKSRKETNLSLHFSQAKEYWNELFEDQPEYVILCNFDLFLIYKWRYQRDPISKIYLKDLDKNWRALAFLLPEKHKIRTHFTNDKVSITKSAAEKVANLYNSLVARGIEKEKAQYFTLQCLISLFAEDTDLFPVRGFFKDILLDCKKGIISSYDIIPMLFQQINSTIRASAGRFKDVKYFDGGIFNHITAIELSNSELDILIDASSEDWSNVSPSIFGNIFEHSLSSEDQHKTGSHFTPENDILRIVEPTVIKPFREKILKTKTLKGLLSIHEEMTKVQILDPACGSGNFLFIAYRELKQLELELFDIILRKFKSKSATNIYSKVKKIKGNQFFGIDINRFAVELAKITLSFAKILTSKEKEAFSNQLKLDGFIDIEFKESALPFENLDDNIIVGDALKIDWKKPDIIIGNPPFQSKNKMQEEFGAVYVDEIRRLFPDVSGLVDYCVYWFRKAHYVLGENGRAGLVGTNTISQTNSRIGSLDYIVSNNGVIIDAIKAMPWQGKAVVSVSIVNWIKTKTKIGKKKIIRNLSDKKDAKWELYEVKQINSSLTKNFDVSKAIKIEVNKKSESGAQGQTHGHSGFILTEEEKMEMEKANKENLKVIYPYLIADVWLGKEKSKFDRYVIDFNSLNIYESQKYEKPFKRVKKLVFPRREQKFKEEKAQNSKLLASNPKAKPKSDWKPIFERWWQLHRSRNSLIEKIRKLDRYIIVSRVGKRQIFDFISSQIHPNDALVAFLFDDDYSFGILQSSFHWSWINARCSTLTDRLRYTVSTIFDTFPFPQWGILNGEEKEKNIDSKIKIAHKVAKKARKLINLRNKIRIENKLSLRDVYRTIELPGKNVLKDAQKELDNAVREAYYYGLPDEMKIDDHLEFLFNLNHLCYLSEKKKKEVIGPGLPGIFKSNPIFYSDYKIGLNGIEL